MLRTMASSTLSASATLSAPPFSKSSPLRPIELATRARHSTRRSFDARDRVERRRLPENGYALVETSPWSSVPWRPSQSNDQRCSSPQGWLGPSAIVGSRSRNLAQVLHRQLRDQSYDRLEDLGPSSPCATCHAQEASPHPCLMRPLDFLQAPGSIGPRLFGDAGMAVLA
jgi:hypothetical protein